MKGKYIAWPILLGLAAVTLSGDNRAADDLYNKKQVKTDSVALPTPAELRSLAVFPGSVTLNGIDDSRQLILTASLVSDRLQDLTGDCLYKVEPAGVVRVTTAGRVIPIVNGRAKVTARFGDKTAQVEVVSAHCDEVLPINFTNHIVPIFTKLGCNSGGCHGKSGGQNGFALSLLGFVPEMDYAALVKEDRGRRLLPAAPENSLLLIKAAGVVAHAGGKRMEVGSDEYKLIRRWIASGTPFGKDTDPKVTSISVEPPHRILTRNNRQQLAVLAHYSDGSVVDVTQRAQYESNESEIAVVDGAGLVRSLQMSGEAAVMARYQGQVTVFRATVPLGMKTPPYEFPARTVVDHFTQKKWQELVVVPSGLCTDGQFIRRVSLAITGTLPTPAQVRAFLNDVDPTKRDKLVDELLETPEYAYYFANKWADVLKVKRKGQPQRAAGTFGFHNWIRESIAQDKPYDRFAREIIAASGTQSQSPPTLWHTELQNPQEYVDDTAQVFLGQRLACAQCHHHPYEKWSQDDYWGLAAFFGRIGRKQVQELGGFQNQQAQHTIVFNRPNGTVINKRTSKPAETTPLDGKPMKIDPQDDPRQKLVDWMVDVKNPFFARAVANRYWAHFFGRGLVDPLDDMRVTNPPSNPELLDALAKELIDSKYSLKHLIRVIVKSRTYQLSSVPHEFNKHDKQAFARFYPQRMSAEVLYDAVNQVTNSPATFGGLPQDRLAPRRAIMLPDESFPSYFLDVFGRPQRISACECERVSEANLAQALHLLNSDEIQNKLARPGSRAELLAKDPRPDAEKVDEMFLWAFARRPTADHLQLALAHINRHAQNKRVAYENVLWALINTKEFQFSQ
jgi:hypothetical protein